MLVSAYAWSRPEHAAASLLAFLERSIDRVDITKCILRDGPPPGRNPKVCDVEPRTTDFATIVNSVPPSDRLLEIECAFTLNDRDRIWLAIMFPGAQFRVTIPWTDMFGSFYAKCSYSAPLTNIIRTSVVEREAALGQPARSHPTPLSDPFTMLFRDLCGMGSDTHSEVMHGQVGFDGWDSPLSAAQVFHSDVREFARDFLRIYLNYHYAVPVTTTFAKPVSIAIENSASQNISSEKRLNFYRWSQAQDKEIETYLNTLDKTDVDRLANLSEQEIREILEVLPQISNQISFEPVGACGGRLAVPLPHNLWAVYGQIQSVAEDFGFV